MAPILLFFFLFFLKEVNATTLERRHIRTAAPVCFEFCLVLLVLLVLFILSDQIIGATVRLSEVSK